MCICKKAEVWPTFFRFFFGKGVDKTPTRLYYMDVDRTTYNNILEVKNNGFLPRPR